jgi:ABC-2 type transport system permease protein
MNKSLLEIIHKNLITLWRSKFSTLAIIVVPLLVILLAGSAFNSAGLSGINVGVYSESYSSLTENILTDFEENFTITRFDSVEECSDSVKNSKAQICIIFPADLSEQGSSEEIIFYADYSRMNIAYNLIHGIESKISSKGSNLGISLAQELITALNSAKDSLPSQKTNVDLSKSNLADIEQKAVHNILLGEIENASIYLNSIYGSVNGSVVKNKINDTLEILESLNESNIEAIKNIGGIKNQSEEATLVLKELSDQIDILIANLQSVNIVDAENIVSPIKTRVESINSNSSNRDYLLPTIISLIALFGGILLASSSILKERKSKAYFRNFMTPTGDFTFLIGNYLTCLMVLIVQFAFVFLGIQYFLHIPLAGMIGGISLILFVALSAFIFIGMFIGYLFKSEETIIFSSVLIAAVMMFFSNTILPIETISSSFKNIAVFNPVVACDLALKKVISFGFDYSFILGELYILGGFLGFFLILSYVGRRITKKML